MTLDEAKRDMTAKRTQLREYRRSLEIRDDPIAKYAATIADGRLQQIEMDISMLSKIDVSIKGASK